MLTEYGGLQKSEERGPDEEEQRLGGDGMRHSGEYHERRYREVEDFRRWRDEMEES